MVCYRVELPRRYMRCSLLRVCDRMRWFLMERGHKMGHSETYGQGARWGYAPPANTEARGTTLFPRVQNLEIFRVPKPRWPVPVEVVTSATLVTTQCSRGSRTSATVVTRYGCR